MDTYPDCLRPLFEDQVHVCRAAPAPQQPAAAENASRAGDPAPLHHGGSERQTTMYANSYLPWQLFRSS